jgi:diphosphomevalonate decarboxylase
MSLIVIQKTHTAPSNIACIKYWGKRDLKTNTPINSSVSVTMNQDDLKAITTVTASSLFEKDRLFLNGIEEDLTNNKRVGAVLREIRARAPSHLKNLYVTVVSRNTFPTAAGLASSAAGYACLVSTLADVFEVKESYKGELSTIARMGSGSACRSLYGGFVRWSMGSKLDGSDSLAIQIAPENHWPELKLLIAVVSEKKKDTGSTDGMVRSVQTSELLKHRAMTVVPARLEALETAYLKKDFDTFAKLTMQDSNQFHACCLDTYPPVFYMNEVSRRIITLVHKLNSTSGHIVAGYTFDAGPNAVIFCLEKNAAIILALLLSHFPLDESNTSTTASSSSSSSSSSSTFSVSEAFIHLRTEAETNGTVEINKLGLTCNRDEQQTGLVRHIYYTSVGDGPRVLTLEESLAFQDGLPKVTQVDGSVDKAL